MTAEGPRFGATPQNPDLLRWIGVQVLLLIIAWVIGMVVRRLLASRWPKTVRVSPLNRARLFFTLRRHRDAHPPAARCRARAHGAREARGFGR